MRLGRHRRLALGRHVRLHLSLDLDMVNLPRVHLYRDVDVISVGLSWGNGYSDPVWSVGLEVWRDEAP